MDMMHASVLRRRAPGASSFLALKRHLRAIASCSLCSVAVLAAVLVMQTPAVRDFCSTMSRAIYVEFAGQLDQMESSMGRPRV